MPINPHPVPAAKRCGWDSSKGHTNAARCGEEHAQSVRLTGRIVQHKHHAAALGFNLGKTFDILNGASGAHILPAVVCVVGHGRPAR